MRTLRHFYSLQTAGGGGTTVSADSLSHTFTLDNAALTQGYVLAAQAAAHAHTLDNATLTQASQLASQALAHGHTLTVAAVSQAPVLALQDVFHGHALASLALTPAYQIAPDGLSHVHVIEGVTILVTDKGVTITFYDGTSLQVSLADIRALWWDADNPSGAPDVEQIGLTTDASGVFEMVLASSSLNVGQSGFLLVWLPDAVEDKDSLAFAGRLEVVNLS